MMGVVDELMDGWKVGGWLLNHTYQEDEYVVFCLPFKLEIKEVQKTTDFCLLLTLITFGNLT